MTAEPYRAAVDAAALFSETDLNGTITYANTEFCRLSGYTPHELLGSNHRLLNSGHHGPAFFSQMWDTISSGRIWRGDICNLAKDGSLYWVASTIVPIQGADGLPERYASIRFDITAMRQMLNAAQWQTHHDPLTGLANRLLLTERFAQAVAQAQREGELVAVCLLDVDGFKHVNDSLGPSQGDALLVTLAQRLRSVLRPLDTAARVGGDEFVLLLTGIHHADEVRQVLKRVMAALAAPCMLGAEAVPISASIGVSMFPTDDTTPDTLLRHADHALYAAKQGGRHRVHFFDSQLDHHATAHYQMLARVTHALAAGELRLHYQPKVNLRTEEVVGFEALLRWQHPTDGLMPPQTFLPLVEQTDVIMDIGNWVLHQALSQMAQRRAQGMGWPVSVNIAARHFQRPDFIQDLQSALAQYPTVQADWLEVEILESVAIDHLQQVQTNLLQGNALGVRFALDDFGTGYSSLGYLKNLSVQVLKVDRSFVRDILQDPGDLALVEAVVGLARVFKREVVAEGVEYPEQGALLQRIGCEVVQGFGIARPMAGDLVAQWAQGFHLDAAWRHWADVT